MIARRMNNTGFLFLEDALSHRIAVQHQGEMRMHYYYYQANFYVIMISITITITITIFNTPVFAA